MTSPAQSLPSDGPIDTPGDPIGELPTPQKAVRWLSPTQLLRTGFEVAQGIVFARYADKREVEASAPAHAYNVSAGLADRTDIWIDFAADVGDGYNATYSIACSIAGAPNISFDESTLSDAEDHDDYGTVRRPGDLLIFGGDEVYPAASHDDYIKRLNNVYREAAGTEDVAPVVAVAGNHDWYDGLVSFRRNFCESWTNEQPPQPGAELPFLRKLPMVGDRDKVGGWDAIQSRSYFAVKLTDNWWLWGTDIQLDRPIDAEQTWYFRKAARNLGNANLIVATARPSWIDDPALDETADFSNKESLIWFIDRVLGPSATAPDRRTQLRLMLSGDEHHYSRYSLTAAGGIHPQELVTCGGGGAFLSSTHQLRDPVTLNSTVPQQPGGPVSSYSRVTRYPTAAQSKQLRKGFWRIPYKNSLLWLFIGMIYLVVLEALAYARCFPHVPDLTALDWRLMSGPAFAGYVPIVVAVVVLFFVLVSFAGYGHEPKNAAQDGLVGTVHAVAHLLVAFLVATLIGALFGATSNDGGWTRLGVNLLLVVVIATAIGVVGTNVFALYLFLANFIGYHKTELFSGMRIEDYKCHLRLHITKDGLRGHAIAIDKVPVAWAVDESGRRRPADGSLIATRQIDSFWIPAVHAPQVHT